MVLDRIHSPRTGVRQVHTREGRNLKMNIVPTIVLPVHFLRVHIEGTPDIPTKQLHTGGKRPCILFMHSNIRTYTPICRRCHFHRFLFVQRRSTHTRVGTCDLPWAFICYNMVLMFKTLENCGKASLLPLLPVDPSVPAGTYTSQRT